MGGHVSKLEEELTELELERLKVETGFDTRQVRRLFLRFKHLDRSNKGYLEKPDLLVLKEIHMNPVGDLIVDSMFDDAHDDRLKFKEFVRHFAHFQPSNHNTKPSHINSRSSKVRYLFSIADRGHNGYLSQDDLLELLHTLMGTTLSEDQVAMIADRMVTEVSTTEDGSLSFEDFERATRELDIEAEMSFISLKTHANKRGFAEGVGLAPNVGLTARDSFVGLEGRL